MRPERKGQDKMRVDSTCQWGEGRAPRPHPTPSGGTGNPARSLLPSSPRASLSSHRGSKRGARVSGRGRTHIPGVSRLRGSGKRGRRGERCPSVSLWKGSRVQPCLSGNAAADTDPARGAGRSRGGGRAGGRGGGWRLKASGVWGSGPVPGHRPGPSWATLTSRRPARQRAPALSGSGSLHPFPGALSTSTSPPQAWAGSLPPLLG